MDEDLKKMIKTLGSLSTVGLTMALSIAIGVAVGYYLDKRFGTEPWFLLIFFGLGVAAAFRNLYRLYKKSQDL
jgi:F0F1-type ATP synthase assembly protein I